MHHRKSVRFQFVQRRNRFDSCFKSVSTRTTFGNAWNDISISPYNSYDELIPFTNQTDPKLFENHEKPFPKRFGAVSLRFHVEACTIRYKKPFPILTTFNSCPIRQIAKIILQCSQSAACEKSVEGHIPFPLGEDCLFCKQHFCFVFRLLLELSSMTTELPKNESNVSEGSVKRCWINFRGGPLM